ncbi:tRNA adenylyltransferase ASCRUDRAFT_36891 [Ascoidea rubescens DSM 1968]|uniref:CCA tRNA nucleotidyltransferase, mitochondrial n=1 Tax=Ascoidea rubescens DSM 1968 TaxID=1344418 RepID=A0A1D2VDW0_9ASCO|nr:hypothetical protein ASCRUDRAFT_36891 [Ascoidea rubescens DSM 1968]ODV59815.1 hypothetical protein ASCRUDRAFT_36891 [Ascoidea rubescens DSM 1968]
MSFSTCSVFQRIQLKPIQLTETETKIRNVLVDFCDYYNYNLKTNQSQDNIVPRVTGGWVRDKLLGRHSNDLDIAINGVSGEEFAESLSHFLQDNYSKYEISPSSIHKIKKNPEKSKHLETATSKLFGQSIDFVNLRSEEYTENSRIPIIKFGTPSEDAYRRDATLNALFYNLKSQSVEDFTDQGIEDLQDGILRTPLDPKQTFLDDPLRVLRLIRFANRFNFQIDQTALNEMSNREISEMLKRKISRERIGTEIRKILISNNGPLVGLSLILQNNLFNSVFNIDGIESIAQKLNENSANMVNDSINKCSVILKDSIVFISNYIKHLDEIKNTNVWFWLFVILKDLDLFKIKVNPNKKQLEEYLSTVIIREALKYGRNDFDNVTLLISHQSEFNGILDKIKEDNLKRFEIGLFIRKLDKKWILMILVEYLFNYNNIEKRENTIKLYNYIIGSGLVDCYEMKSLVVGKELANIFNKKAGPWMKKVLDEIIIWQLENPEKNKEDCVKFIKTLV